MVNKQYNKTIEGIDKCMMIKDNNIRWVNKEDGMNKGSVM